METLLFSFLLHLNLFTPKRHCWYFTSWYDEQAINRPRPSSTSSYPAPSVKSKSEPRDFDFNSSARFNSTIQRCVKETPFVRTFHILFWATTRIWPDLLFPSFIHPSTATYSRSSLTASLRQEYRFIGHIDPLDRSQQALQHVCLYRFSYHASFDYEQECLCWERGIVWGQRPPGKSLSSLKPFVIFSTTSSGTLLQPSRMSRHRRIRFILSTNRLDVLPTFFLWP